MEEDIVATIRADLSQFQASMRQMVSTVQQASQQSQQHIKGIDTTMTQLATTAKSVGAAMGVAVSCDRHHAVWQAAVKASTQMTAFTLSLKQATGSMSAAKAELAFVRAEADRLGTSFTTSVEGFTKLSNATKGTVLAGEATREIFTALSEANQTLGLSTDQYGRALLAVSQIALKGRVQQEELLQLAEAGIPVYQALAKSLGVSTQALSKMAEQGLISADALRGMSKVLSQEFAAGAREAAQTFQGAMNRMDSATQGLLVVLGDLITKNPEVIRGINAMATSINTFTEALRASMPTLQSWLSAVITFIEKTGTLSTLPQDLERLTQELTPVTIRAAVIPDLGTGMFEPLAGGLSKNAERVKALTEEYTKLQAKITEIQGLLTQHKAGRLSLSAEEVQLLNIELDAAKEKLQKALDPQVLKRAAQTAKDTTQAVKEALRAEQDFAEETVQLMRGRIEAQEQANEERLENEHATMEAFRRIQQDGWKHIEADEEHARATIEQLRNTVAENEQKRQDEALKKAQADFQRFQEQVSGQRQRCPLRLYQIPHRWLDEAQGHLERDPDDDQRYLPPHPHGDGRAGAGLADPHSGRA